MMAGGARAASAVDAPLKSGHLNCGVITEPLDWNKDDLHGNLAALGAEMCRAVATSVFGHADRFQLQSYTSEQEGLAALKAGRSDIVAGVTPNSVNAVRFGVRYSMAYFQDSQGFMVHKAERVHSAADIAGHKLCYIDGTDNDSIALATLTARGIRPVPFPFQEEGEMDAAIMDRHCQVTTALLSKLAEARGTFHNGRDYVFLPDVLALSPVTIATNIADARLGSIVDYAISALLQAEFLGVNLANARTAPSSENAQLARLLGQDWSTAQSLGLAHDWSRTLIATVGNYAEIYDRSVGPGTLFNLPRGINALWNQGGILAPLPLQ
jgi:general L-amino acid transport system substrate-binding protein